jgi:hypothetical protein
MQVPGGYCQHTEGLGEMAEKRSRWHAGQPVIWISVSPFAVALSELELRSSHPHPAGAPRCPFYPPEPACRGGPSIRLDAGRLRVTRSSTHAVPKTGCGLGYFFFRRFVVFFAAFFAFLFFAIAALLA